MKSTNTRSVGRPILPDPLAASVLVGAIGRVYAVAELQEQPTEPHGPVDAGSSVAWEGETLLREALRLKIEVYRHRYF